MTYDPKNRPTYLGPDHLRHKRTLTQGYMTVADSNQNSIPAVQESTVSKVLGILKLVALVLAGVASTIVAAAASGAAIHPTLLTIASIILAVATPLGIASPGLQSKAPAVKLEKGPEE